MYTTQAQHDDHCIWITVIPIDLMCDGSVVRRQTTILRHFSPLLLTAIFCVQFSLRPRYMEAHVSDNLQEDGYIDERSNCRSEHLMESFAP